MRHAQLNRIAGVFALLLGALIASVGALAQDAPVKDTAAKNAPAQDAQGQETPAADEPVKQIKLTEGQVKNFISAQPDLAAVAGKLQEAGNEPDAALQAELDGIAKKHGFSDFSELDDVAANISIVMAGLDSQTGVFTDPVDALKKELADVEADGSIPESDKKQLEQELNEAIKTTPPLTHKENVDLVKAHREEIEKALE